MVNVMVWVRSREAGPRHARWKNRTDAEHRVSLSYLRAQVENSLSLGWRHDQIFVYTNFPFEWAGVKSRMIRGLFPGNSFVNKWVAVRQMYETDRVRDDVFFHDTDAFQCVPFDFPNEVTGIGFARAHGQWRWGCGVAFIRRDCVPGLMRRFFEAVARRDTVSNDEHIWDELSRNPRFERYFQPLPRTYNVAEGRHWQAEADEADRPIRVLHIKPHLLFRPWHWWRDADGKRYTMAAELTPPRLRDLFIRHRLWHPHNDRTS